MLLILDKVTKEARDAKIIRRSAALKIEALFRCKERIVTGSGNCQ